VGAAGTEVGFRLGASELSKKGRLRGRSVVFLRQLGVISSWSGGWAGLAPRLDESAGKRRSTRIRNGAPWLKPALVQAGWAATRKKNTYLQAQFLRLKARRGPKKALIAVAASILTIVYHMLRDGTCYRDLGPEYFARRNPAKLAAKLAHRNRNLGYHVEISAAAQPRCQFLGSLDPSLVSDGKEIKSPRVDERGRSRLEDTRKKKKTRAASTLGL
jgi:transposase